MEKTAIVECEENFEWHVQTTAVATQDGVVTIQVKYWNDRTEMQWESLQ